MASARITYQYLNRRAPLQLSCSARDTSKVGFRCIPTPFAAGLQISVQARLASDKKPPQKPAKAESPPELPNFSLQSLNLSPRMRMFLIVALCIFGTIETMTWSIFLYNRFWKKDGAGEEREDVD